MKIVLLIFLYWFAGILVSHTQWKVSKAMKNTLKAEEENIVEDKKIKHEYEASAEKDLKIKNIKTKSFQDLRDILYPKYEAKHIESLTRHPPLQLSKKDCTRHEPLWVRF